MNYEQRAQIRQARDQATRDRIARERAGRKRWCAGCGGELNTYTQGCDTCANRRQRRARDAAKKSEQRAAAWLEALK